MTPASYPAYVMDQADMLHFQKQMFWHYYEMDGKDMAHQNVIDTQIEYHLAKVTELNKQLQQIDHLLNELNDGTATTIYRQ